MKRLITLLLALLGIGMIGCEPHNEDENIPVPEYGVPYASFREINK